MIFLAQLKPINSKNSIVGYIHYDPFNDEYGLNESVDNLKKEGIIIDSIPKPSLIKNKVPELHVNPETNEVWYEYSEIPKSDEELTKDTIDNLQKDNALLLKENAKKDAMIESLNKDVADIYKVIGGNK
ncbi:hypothetical protein [Clostridium frigidicarnis]|uniref:Uncharacterized protein n=1 Tax=Clostridium frigidicarnis TaxID=84698 RepID=A0A1I0V0X5_9CLOT|nr:hypothetical protein [Clostridium frigidicarnis]SFA69984.1 hypothetical protein SAMN04488528_100178 [Clostridium frigidicarnis]